MDNFDARVIFVLAPILVAAGWATFNIGAAALRQIQGFINRKA